MKNEKKISRVIIIALVMIASIINSAIVFSQQAPTGSAGTSSSWLRGGNLNAGGGGSEPTS